MSIIGPTAPSGPAGGSLAGTYPNPTLANPVGAWEPAVNNATGLEYVDVTEFKTIRFEAEGKAARLRARVKTGAANPIAAGKEIISFKSVFNPEKEQTIMIWNLTTKAWIQCTISITAVLTTLAEIVAANELSLWNATYVIK